MNPLIVLTTYFLALLGLVGLIWFSNRLMWCHLTAEKALKIWLGISGATFITGVIGMITTFVIFVNK